PPALWPADSGFPWASRREWLRLAVHQSPPAWPFRSLFRTSAPLRPCRPSRQRGGWPRWKRGIGQFGRPALQILLWVRRKVANLSLGSGALWVPSLVNFRKKEPNLRLPYATGTALCQEGARQPGRVLGDFPGLSLCCNALRVGFIAAAAQSEVFELPIES